MQDEKLEEMDKPSAVKEKRSNEEDLHEDAETNPITPYSIPSFFAGAMLTPITLALWAIRPVIMRQFLRRAKKNNPMHSV